MPTVPSRINPILRHVVVQLVLLSCPLFAHAGVLYDLAIRTMDQSNVALTSPDSPVSPPVVTRYFVEDGKVRIGGPNARFVYVFKDHTMYVVDNTAHVVHVLRHATLSQIAAHYDEAIKQLQAAAASASPDDKPEAERKASDMKEVSDRVRQPVARDFRVTVRFESVDGHACRIWEEREKDVKRLELCVAPASGMPGGADILNGMKTLSQYREGSSFALGVNLGLSEWWSDIEHLGGVPILIREYKYESQISEVMISGMRQAPVAASQFEMPANVPAQDGPDYASWYVR